MLQVVPYTSHLMYYTLHVIYYRLYSIMYCRTSRCRLQVADPTFYITAYMLSCVTAYTMLQVVCHRLQEAGRNSLSAAVGGVRGVRFGKRWR